MADAWSTVVTREPEWDDFGRSQIFALMAWESGCCPKCGNYDSMQVAGRSEQYVTLPDGRVIGVQFHRCPACGLEEMVRRQWHETHKNDTPTAVGALASDGLIFVARPTEED